MRVIRSNLNAAILGHRNALGAFGTTNHVEDTHEGTVSVNNLRYVSSHSSDGAVYTSVAEYSKERNKQFATLLEALGKGHIDYISFGAHPDSLGLLESGYYDTSNGFKDSSDTDVLILIRDPEISSDSIHDHFCLLWGNSADRKIYNGRIDIELKYSDVELAREGRSIWEYLIEASSDTSSPIDIDFGDEFVRPDEVGLVAIKGVVVQGKELIEHYITSDEKGLTIDAPKGTMQAEIKQPIKETEKMSKAQSIVSTLVASNKAAAINAGEMEAGRAINKRIAAVFGSKVKLPFGTSGMINTPIGHVVLANMFATLIREYAPDNKLAQRAADGAVKSAAYELLRDFDVPAMLDEILDGVVLKDDNKPIEL